MIYLVCEFKLIFFWCLLIYLYRFDRFSFLSLFFLKLLNVCVWQCCLLVFVKIFRLKVLLISFFMSLLGEFFGCLFEWVCLFKLLLILFKMVYVVFFVLYIREIVDFVNLGFIFFIFCLIRLLLCFMFLLKGIFFFFIL